ncbi:MAG TPA: class I SAM-dependent methyltransferase [Rhizomicrobium sp.]|jgi:cyclopropane fatty-acyl-phospholipid synthase-like methyltransferase
MQAHAIAEHAATANQQHYELPPEFFALVLGRRRKYSSCLYAYGADSLDEAEEVALSEIAAHADLHDGQTILELGCGWGSLSLWMAEHFPNARIAAVPNSAPQRRFIESRAPQNLRVITADMNDFTIDRHFDRIVSVEMFEHMANWRGLLTRARLAEAGGAALPSCFRPCARTVPLRPSGRERLDRAALLHWRHHAQPRPHSPIPRPLRRRAGVALERNALPPHRH